MAKQFVACVLLFFSLCAIGAEDNALRNQLVNHPSPYLALHGSDPVAWQEWNAETVSRARRENKLLYVSVGYYACHWCHVMQRESYKNSEIAALLNRDFIPVKVDRELHTGLDDALQEFSAQLLKIGGWPLNAFVTPEGFPVYVVLYTPPKDFQNVLMRLSDKWKDDNAVMKELARQAASGQKQQIPRQPVNASMQGKWEKGFLQQVRTEMDELHGGFGEVSKFPMAPQLGLILDILSSKPDARLESFLRLTLDQMASKGLHDHVNGGFFRYTTDPGWETPHFEKMLYDNALLVRIYLRAAEVLNEPRYKALALQAVDFMLDGMASPQGGFFTSTSAVDEQGREGAYYLWTDAELRKVLDVEEYKAAVRVWRLSTPPPFELGYLPAEWAAPSAKEQKILLPAYSKLREAARKRILPKDEKRNAGLNGLALSALADAMRADPRYREAAGNAYLFIRKQIMGSDGLYKSVSRGSILVGAELEDYAYVVEGLMDYAAAAGESQPRKDALLLARLAWKRFATEQGWRREEQTLLATLRPEAVLADGPVPSPSAVLVGATLGLDDGELGARTREALQWHSTTMARDPFSYASQIRAYRKYLNSNSLPSRQPASAGAQPVR